MELTRLTADVLYEHQYWGDLIHLAENERYESFKFKPRVVENNCDMAGVYIIERATGKVYKVPNQSQMYKVMNKK